ncbi:hypothetical protein [Aureimonas phyllosphaerae]|uniref:Uncharacterized protein n=1 Tax=Aureimonas phyllosphaerae TaxID=1166078 RepID=A0A7W6BVC5_9HYPH|nr:hypothetical protein [Aureimonas phyllosphaerae]MBB3935758.1 hypothetical protein [Aureimonas phyllosphaerae]MBB3959766.1 hypothetical protein [Aureimonas phyllosphaerae]SFF14775.1 hypothetical protein SAMN05216566_103297 [Aureimonas phyllosphaerae]
MLVDLIVSRSALGADRGRDDLHRHATFSCGIHAMVRRVLHLFKAA